VKESILIEVTDRIGQVQTIEAPLGVGLNVMELCKASELPVEGTCGGMALCASCHIYIESEHELSEMSEDEEDMLDQAFFVEDNSRLGCQIHLTEQLDNLKIRLAPVDENDI